MTAMAKACAWLNGREYVVPSDVQEIFPCVTEHRIILNMKAKVGHIKKEELIRRVLESVPTPTMRQKYEDEQMIKRIIGYLAVLILTIYLFFMYNDTVISDFLYLL